MQNIHKISKNKVKNFPEIDKSVLVYDKYLCNVRTSQGMRRPSGPRP